MYTTVYGLLNQQAYQAFINEAYALLQPESEISSNVVRVNADDLTRAMTDLFTLDSASYLTRMKILASLMSFRSLLKVERLLELLTKDYGFRVVTSCGSPVLHVSSKQVEIRDGATTVGWHQDWPNTGGAKRSVVVWLPLVGCAPSGGGITFAQGDQFPLLEYVLQPSYCGISEDITNKFETEYLCPRIGDALLFDQFQPHRSTPPNHIRLAASFRFEDATDFDWRQRNYQYLHRKVQDKLSWEDWQKCG